LKSVHIIYTQVEPDICRGETFKETFLEPSCECCGSDEHAMLVRSTNPQHRTGFEYMCPVATYKNLDHFYPRYPINLDFYACPLKFAEIHHYTDDERLTIALEKYRTMSAARVDYSYSQNFTDEVKRLCEEYKYRLNFKRCRLNESSNDDDEDAEGEHSDQETALQDEKTTDEEKVKDDPQPKLKEREG
jgi:hypothetical protein